MAQIEDSVNALHPYVREKLLQSLKECKKQKKFVSVFETKRSAERQNRLYSQGKTKAKAGDSNHQFGLAFDLCFEKNGKRTWEGDWNSVGSIMMKHGFAWGRFFSSFPEDCHFEMTFDIPKASLRNAWRSGGHIACWKLVDAKLKKERTSTRLPFPKSHSEENHVSITDILWKILSKIIVKKIKK